jgi:hypothetical protein
LSASIKIEPWWFADKVVASVITKSPLVSAWAGPGDDTTAKDTTVTAIAPRLHRRRDEAA